MSNSTGFILEYSLDTSLSFMGKVDLYPKELMKLDIVKVLHFITIETNHISSLAFFPT